LERIWRTVRRQDVFPVSTIGAVVRMITRRGYLITQAGLRTLFERHLGGQRLEATPLPSHVVATDLLAGTEVRLTAGSPARSARRHAAWLRLPCTLSRS
jgi:NTE family protein